MLGSEQRALDYPFPAATVSSDPSSAELCGGSAHQRRFPCRGREVLRYSECSATATTTLVNAAATLVNAAASGQCGDKDDESSLQSCCKNHHDLPRQAYSEIRGIVNSINSVSILDEVRQDIVNVKARIGQQSVDEALSEIKAAYSVLTRIPGANNAAKSLSNARRLIDRKDPNLPKAVAFVDETLASINAELTWRGKAKQGPYEKLAAFEAYARSNLGLREQDRLNPEQVDSITSCLAKHRSLALQF